MPEQYQILMIVTACDYGTTNPRECGHEHEANVYFTIRESLAPATRPAHA